jgi:hypothetical protein
MIYAVVTAYFMAWFLVFWQLPAKGSPLRFFAFIPAFVLAIAVPGFLWESTLFPVNVQFGMLIASGFLPFILAGVIWWKKDRGIRTTVCTVRGKPRP